MVNNLETKIVTGISLNITTVAKKPKIQVTTVGKRIEKGVLFESCGATCVTVLRILINE